MKVASFNANGIRARLPIILDWLERECPDLLGVQETKVQDKDFPSRVFEEAGYSCVFRGEKGYNGVAIISNRPLDHACFGFADGDSREETRLVRGMYKGISVVNTYVPQGLAPYSEKFRYKLDWFQRLRDYFSRSFDPKKPLLWMGDFNVAPEPIDVYDPKNLLGNIGFHPDEHTALAGVKSWGLVDVFRKHQPEGGMYTFWDYRVPNALKRGMGWRIDHIWATASLAQKSTRAWVDLSPRLLEKPSDHTFIVAEFDG